MAALSSWTSIIAHHTFKTHLKDNVSSSKSYLRLVVNYWYQFIFTITFFCPCWFFSLGANVWLSTHFVVYTVRYTQYTWTRTQTPTCSALFSAHLKVTGLQKVCGSIPTVRIIKSPRATCWCVSSFWAVGQWNPVRCLLPKVINDIKKRSKRYSEMKPNEVLLKNTLI